MWYSLFSYFKESSEAFQARQHLLLDQGKDDEIDVTKESTEKRDWMFLQLIDRADFTDKTYKALQKNYGPLTIEDCFINYVAEGQGGLSFIEYLLDRMDFSQNNARILMRYILVPANNGFWYGWVETQKRLIIRLLASGADLNEIYAPEWEQPREDAPSWSMPLLQCVIYHRCNLYWSANRIHPARRRERARSPGYHFLTQRDQTLFLTGEDRQLIRYLLEKGADPLLTGQTGENAIELVNTIDISWTENGFLPKEEKAWILAELERWA